MVSTLEDQVAELKGMLALVLERLESPQSPRSCYSVEEAASLLGKAPYTVREWCRGGRVHAVKRQERRGGVELWGITSAELARIRDEGLLEPDPRRNAG